MTPSSPSAKDMGPIERELRKRDWRIWSSPLVQTCNECGRSTEPHQPYYVDQVSGHLVRHIECHHKASELGL